MVEFEAEVDHCPQCHGPLQVQKARRRQVLTLTGGAFVAKEVLKHCAACTAGFTFAALTHLGLVQRCTQVLARAEC